VSLLDAAPLRGFLTNNLQLDRIQGHIDAGRLFALAVVGKVSWGPQIRPQDSCYLGLGSTDAILPRGDGVPLRPAFASRPLAAACGISHHATIPTHPVLPVMRPLLFPSARQLRNAWTVRGMPIINVIAL
jgi:hypothetical protein